MKRVKSVLYCIEAMMILWALSITPLYAESDIDLNSKETIISVQEALNSYGYDCGKLDGSVGEKTHAALLLYQEDKGLEMSGVIDEETYHSLMNVDKSSNNEREEETTGISVPKEREVKYSTNTKDSVKDGNSGIYSYRNRGKEYYTYYIIDFDDGCVYRFTDDETGCMKTQIASGDLNDGLVITYHDGSDIWQEGLCFAWKNQPDHLILQDSYGFKTDFYTIDLDDALEEMNKKIITEY